MIVIFIYDGCEPIIVQAPRPTAPHNQRSLEGGGGAGANQGEGSTTWLPLTLSVRAINYCQHTQTLAY